MTTAEQWGGPARLSAWESLMWRAEGDPRTRSTGILLEILDSEPEWERFKLAHDRTVAKIPRLRERIIEPLVTIAEPVWSPDPDFRLDLHVHRARLHEPGTEAQLFEFVESQFNRPLDRARPPWEATLVTGLQGDRAAYLLKFHHALSDGLGLIQLLTFAHSPTSRRSPLTHTRPPAPRRAYRPIDLVTESVQEAVSEAPRRLYGLVRDGIGAGRRILSRPVDTVTDGVGYARSAVRTLSPPEASRSPILEDRGVGSRLLRLDVSFDDLRNAGRAVGGSLNDAFVAAMLGGLRAFHEREGVMVDSIPIGMPVSLRKENDPLGGNKFTGAQFAAPLAEPDPARRMHLIREHVTKVRQEPALGIIGAVSPLLSRLPVAILTDLAANFTTTSDLQVSNIRGISHPCYLAGAQVLGMYPLGPRPGVAVMAAMVTYNGTCCIGINANPNVFPQVDVLRDCLQAGFDEVIALGRPVSSSATTPARAAKKPGPRAGAGAPRSRKRTPQSPKDELA